MVAGGDTTVTGPSQEQAAAGLTPSSIFQDDLGYDPVITQKAKPSNISDLQNSNVKLMAEDLTRFSCSVTEDCNLVDVTANYYYFSTILSNMQFGIHYGNHTLLLVGLALASANWAIITTVMLLYICHCWRNKNVH